MSTGAKIAIGCGILAVLAIIAIVIATVAGGLFLKKKADEFAGGMEAQEEATATIQELEREHAFSPPANAVVSEASAEKFFAVTDDAWERMRESMEEMAERGREIEERGGEAGLGDAMAGIEALGQWRVAIADALDTHDMPVSEYLWAGLALMRAYQFLEMPAEESGVPAENLALANEHREELAEIAEQDEDGRPDKGAVLAMAWTWGMTEVPQAAGLDTLGAYVPSQ